MKLYMFFVLFLYRNKYYYYMSIFNCIFYVNIHYSKQQTALSPEKS